MYLGRRISVSEKQALFILSKCTLQNTNHEVIVVQVWRVLYLNPIMCQSVWLKLDKHHWKNLNTHTRLLPVGMWACGWECLSISSISKQGMSERVLSFRGWHLLCLLLSCSVYLSSSSCVCSAPATVHVFSLESSLFYDLDMKDSELCVSVYARLCISLPVCLYMCVHACVYAFPPCARV